MLIRVVARSIETTEDNILQGLPPLEEAYVWKIKYINVEDIEEFEELDKKKTVVFFYNGRVPIVLKEHPDDFFSRWKQAMKEVNKKEDDLELELEEDEAEEDEDNETS
jgi:hypothetical protein